MLAYVLLIVTAIPQVFGASNSSGSGNGSDSSLMALDDLHLLQSGQLVDLSSVPTLASSLLDLTARLLEQISTIVENAVGSQLTGNLGFLLKALLTPVIVLVEILLYGVKILLDVLLYGLTRFLLFPLLGYLGLESLDGALDLLTPLIDTVLDGLSCILSKLSFIQIFSRKLPTQCHQHLRPLLESHFLMPMELARHKHFLLKYRLLGVHR